MSDIATLDRPTADFSKTASAGVQEQEPQVSTPTPASDLNIGIQNQREWLARARMFGGEIIGMNNQIKHQKQGQFKHAFSSAAGAFKTMFDWRNPMAIFGSFYNLGLGLFDLHTSMKETAVIETKRKNFIGFLDGHVAEGVKLMNGQQLINATGQEVNVPEFVKGFVGELSKAEYSHYREGLRDLARARIMTSRDDIPQAQISHALRM